MSEQGPTLQPVRRLRPFKADGRWYGYAHQIGAWALRILAEVYQGATSGPAVAKATGLPLEEVHRIAKSLRRRGWLCCDLPEDRPRYGPRGRLLKGEDWAIRDETRAIPEIAHLRGVRCVVAPQRTQDPTTRKGRQRDYAAERRKAAKR